MDFKNKTKEELVRALETEREKLRSWRFAVAGGKAKNVKEGSVFRREIARILTQMNKK
jgi:ribosomal protein L29